MGIDRGPQKDGREKKTLKKKKRGQKVRFSKGSYEIREGVPVRAPGGRKRKSPQTRSRKKKKKKIKKEKQKTARNRASGPEPSTERDLGFGRKKGI